jgi:hypothetical protein
MLSFCARCRDCRGWRSVSMRWYACVRVCNACDTRARSQLFFVGFQRSFVALQTVCACACWVEFTCRRLCQCVQEIHILRTACKEVKECRSFVSLVRVCCGHTRCVLCIHTLTTRRRTHSSRSCWRSATTSTARRSAAPRLASNSRRYQRCAVVVAVSLCLCVVRDLNTIVRVRVRCSSCVRTMARARSCTTSCCSSRRRIRSCWNSRLRCRYDMRCCAMVRA